MSSQAVSDVRPVIRPRMKDSALFTDAERVYDVRCLDTPPLVASAPYAAGVSADLKILRRLDHHMRPCRMRLDAR